MPEMLGRDGITDIAVFHKPPHICALAWAVSRIDEAVGKFKNFVSTLDNLREVSDMENVVDQWWDRQSEVK